MKANHYFCLAAVFAATCLLCSSSFKKNAYQQPGEDQIIIRQRPGELEDDPRGPVFNPFTAYLYNNQVVLNCSTSYGDVDVSLVSTAGDNYSTVFDTADGFIIIPISGLAGDYTLLLTDSLGIHFTGEFEL